MKTKTVRVLLKLLLKIQPNSLTLIPLMDMKAHTTCFPLVLASPSNRSGNNSPAILLNLFPEVILLSFKPQ